MIKCPLGPNLEYQLLGKDEGLLGGRKSYVFEGILRSRGQVFLITFG